MIPIDALNSISEAIHGIPPSSFMASQAVTCKIETVLRDHIYFIMSSNKKYFLKKEVQLTKSRSFCDLVLYEQGNKNPLIAIELKQFYSEDVVYSDRMRKKNN